MKQSNKGYTLVELLIVVLTVGTIAAVIFGAIANNRGWTEDRAKENAVLFINDNHIAPSRLSCAGDSDQDGYGSCSIVTLAGENIQVQCPTDFISVRIFGATGCKEITGISKFVVR